VKPDLRVVEGVSVESDGFEGVELSGAEGLSGEREEAEAEVEVEAED